jgi:amino acid adenylation domain-containing protein
VKSTDLAVVGMAGRFPGAADVGTFWSNLCSGTESITFYDGETLRAAGVPEPELNDPDYVRAAATVDGHDLFDARLFGYSAREAALLDPQHRLFLECCWAALEDAGYPPGREAGSVGVYAGASLSSYLIAHVLAGRLPGSVAETLDLLVSNDKDYLASRVAYHLDLDGPAVAVQSACSSSLVAVHVAGQALLGGECDVAIAGGVALRLPQPRGYRYQENLVFSPDGHCRPFDADGRGTIFGSGVGAVVLKRLDDALADGDHIEAVVKGSAVNNDGGAKIGYTAPGIEGQAGVIAAALGVADVEPDTVTAIEAHGTATPVGDPIEIAALSRVFASRTDRKGFCAIGSVKSNVGHLDSASGITGFIKAVLQAKHGLLVPSLHFRRANPDIDFAATPFVVNTELRDWDTDGVPRRIGISSFGMGGTNAHVVIEQPPERVPAPRPVRPVQLLALSAREPEALGDASAALATALRAPGAPQLPDVAHTLRVGRAAFGYRQVTVGRDAADAADALDAPGSIARAAEHVRPVWLFPGQGSQYPGMGRTLYRAEPGFAGPFDECLAALPPETAARLRKLLLGEIGDVDDGSELTRTELAQPALFTIGYALARLLGSWGLAPHAMLGHSVGELVAACLAGVFTLPDAVRVVAARGRLMQRMAPGAMLAVSLPEAEIRKRLEADSALALAAVNADDLTVVAGPDEAVEQLRQRLSAEDVAHRPLHTSHAFHSAMMEPMADAFATELSGVVFSPPRVPYLSNRTGTWVTAEQATDPAYWVGHVRDTVRFGDGVRALREWAGDASLAFLELGPGHTLCTLARETVRAAAIPLLPAANEPRDEQESVLEGVGRLWAAGAEVDLGRLAGPGRRVSLPTYPFRRRRYWIDGGGSTEADEAQVAVDVPLDPRPALRVPFEAPRTDTERRLAEVWQDLLGVGPIGVHDPFVELGGHSLMATRVVERVRERFGVRIPLRRMLSAPTVAGLAELIGASGDDPAGNDDTLPAAVPEPDARFEPFPLTEIQQAQWLGRSAEFAGGNTAAHVYWEVEGVDVDVDRLGQAWQRVVDRHDMLRAVLTPDGQQRILPDTGPYRIVVTDLRTDPERDAQLRALRERLSHEMRPADRWPLFEIRAVLLPGSRTRVLLSFDLLIADIGSIRLLLRDWHRFYREPDADRPPLGLSFRDYVRAVRRLPETAQYARALEYWREQLAGLPPRPDLPLAVNPAAVGRPEFTARDLVVERDRWSRLRDRAAARGLTVSAVLLAAYATILGGWSRSGRFTVNVTVINRLPVHPDVRDLVGEFASFDLLPVDLTGSADFAALATSLQEQSWQDLEHRYVNGVELLRELARTRGGAAGSVLPFVFTSTLVQENEPGDTSMFGWLGDVVHEIAQTPQVWIDFALLEVAAGVQLSWHAVRQLFPDGVLDAMFAAFADLVHRLADDEDTWSDRPAPLPDEHRAMVAAVNDTAGAHPDGLLCDPVVAQARRAPERLAVAGADGELTYGDLYRNACRLAQTLRAAGTGAGDLVAVAIAKSRAQIVAALAVNLAGGAYLPLDPGLPRQRQDQLIAQSQARVALVPIDGDREDWPDGVRVLPVELAGGEDVEPPQQVARPTDLAYVIFTSGSTGVPKGVMISHRAALNTVDDISTRYHVGPEDRVLGLSSLSFDLSVYDVFGVLGAGGTLVLPRAGSSRDPGHWLDLMARYRVTLWNSVPALAQMLADHALGEQLASGAERHPALRDLRLAMMSGDWIPLDLPDRLRSVAPDAQLVSLGGATEAAIWSIAYDIGAVDPGWDSVPYGRPLRNQTFHVFNDRMRECPAWVTGELYIGGSGVAEGYWADPERTATSFVTHPATGERLYRTGDLGRWRPDGLIEFLGREDNQVKIGGFRIELGEIDAVLSRQPGVAAGVAAAVGADRHHRRLVGYLVPADPDTDTEPLIDAVRTAALGSLPAYLVPGAFVVLEKLPLSSNGKVDRAALPDPAASRSTGDAGPTAAALAALVREVVGVPEVGPDDNFFTVGGDSITGIQVVARATAEGLPLTTADLFGQPTIRALAALVESRQGGPGAAPEQEPTPYQQYLLANGAGAMRALVPMHGDPSAVATRAGEVLRELHSSHPALRQRLRAGRLTLAAPDPADGHPHVSVVPLGRLPEARRAAALAGLADEIAGELDAEQGPAVKAAVFDLGGGELRLCVAALELICDARSWSALLTALGDAPVEPGGPLLSAALHRYRLPADEVLAVLVADAVRDLGASGPVTIDIEADRREDLSGGPVGPYAAVVPCTFALDADLGALIPAAKQSYRVADDGPPAGGLLVRFLGAVPADPELAGPDPASRGHDAVVTGWVAGGELRFVVTGPDAAGLSSALERARTRFTDHLAGTTAGAVSPSDFPLADLDADELAQFLQQVEPEGAER